MSMRTLLIAPLIVVFGVASMPIETRADPPSWAPAHGWHKKKNKDKREQRELTRLERADRDATRETGRARLERANRRLARETSQTRIEPENREFEREADLLRRDRWMYPQYFN